MKNKHKETNNSDWSSICLDRPTLISTAPPSLVEFGGNGFLPAGTFTEFLPIMLKIVLLREYAIPSTSMPCMDEQRSKMTVTALAYFLPNYGH